MTAGKRWRSGLFVAGLFGVVIALVAVLSPREQLLLQRATRVMRTDKGKNFLGWLSDHEALSYQSTNKEHSLFLLFRYDLRTGRETPLPALTRILNKSFAGNLGQATFDPSPVSPDGQWLYWRIWKTRSRVEGATLDGAHHFEVLEPFRVPRWMPDSHHWIEFVADRTHNLTGARICSIEAPYTVQTLQFMPPLPSGTPLDVAVTSQAHLMILLSNGRRPIRTARLGEFDLHAQTGPLRTFPIRTPAVFPQGIFSPQGDHIAWLRETGSAPLASSLWLHRLFPRIQAPMQWRATLWVSRLDGSQMREIGHIRLKQGAVGPFQLQWMPGGKRLSFLYQDALYTVPAD